MIVPLLILLELPSDISITFSVLRRDKKEIVVMNSRRRLPIGNLKPFITSTSHEKLK
jgi:hypothetical protein